jgi:small redox-active disulfide protein 2
MMKIQVLGSGCPTCKKLFEMTQKVVKNIDEKLVVEYVTGVEASMQIVALGVMSSPVLVVDDRVAMTGFTPDEDKIREAILQIKHT